MDNGDDASADADDGRVEEAAEGAHNDEADSDEAAEEDRD